MSTPSHRVTPAPRGVPHLHELARARVAGLPLPLWAALLLGVLLRVAVALLMGDRVTVLPGIYDQLSYHALAQRVLGGYGFSFDRLWWPITAAGAPTAHWSFLYTLALAGVYALVGIHPLAARLLQAVAVGLLLPWLSWRVGRRVFGERPALLAAGLSALYLYFVYYAAALMTESLYIVVILWSMDVALRLGAQLAGGSAGAARTWTELGVAVGVAALLRQLFLLWLPFLLGWLLWQAWRARSRVGWRALLGRGALLGAVLATLILPVTAYNAARFGRFVLLNTNAGYAFFWANHPIYGTRFVGILDDEQPSYQSLIPERLRALDEAALDQALLREGLRFVTEDPARYVLLSLSRVPEYFRFWPSARSSLLSNLVRVLSFGVALPLMLLGLWHAARGGLRGPDGAGGGGLLLLFVLVYTAIHLLSWSLIRYRLPVDAVGLLFAGLGLSALLEKRRF